MFVCFESCVLSSRCLCDELITRQEKSYWLWCVVVCDVGNSKIRRPWPALGRGLIGKKLLSLHENGTSLTTLNRKFWRHVWRVEEHRGQKVRSDNSYQSFSRLSLQQCEEYEGWNFNNGNYLFTTDTKKIHVSKFYCPSV